MGALVERFGPAPRAFLVLPMVGAFFIDFTNAIIITAYINLLGRSPGKRPAVRLDRRPGGPRCCARPPPLA